MESAKEYREYADECMAWAKDALTDTERDLFLRMAEDWRRAALLVEGKSASQPPMRKAG
jgi:hypothetical protein